jgi:hypothetical protein
MPRYLECTYLALWFSTVLRVTFVDEPTVVWHTDTPASVSKSGAYRLGQEAALRQLLELELPPLIRKCLRNRLGDACHNNATTLLAEGQWVTAWQRHLASLATPGGWRRIPYTWTMAISRVRGKAPAP